MFIITVLLSNNVYADRVSDLVYMWNKCYDEDNVRSNHPNRKNFEQYASFVEEVLHELRLEYQKDGKSGKLPIIYPSNDKYLHIVVGAMIFKETAVRSNIIGKARNEVGLLQVHGIAQNKFKKKEIINNPKLGIYLGTRWFLHCLYLSKLKINDMKDYGPAMSFFTCGTKCKGKLIKPVKYRLKLAYKYQGGIVRPIERLVEAVSYQLSEGDEWWEEFDSKTDAINVLNNAKDTNENELKEYLIELYYDGISFDESYETMWKKLIKELRKQLKNG